MDPSEKLTIETPEQIALEFPLAGLGSRGLALLTDTAIQLLSAIVVVLIVGFTAPDLLNYWQSAGKWMVAAGIFLLFCLYWGYFALFEAFWNGQTPGKRQAKIRVISASGRPITVFESIARNFLRVIDSQLFYLVGCISCALDSRNRRLGDMVAGTVAVHEVQEQGDSYWYASERPAAVAPIGDKIAALSAQEFQLIETFLNRRLDLPLDQRAQTAQNIANRIGDHLAVAVADRPSNEDFLEEVARRYREAARFR